MALALGPIGQALPSATDVPIPYPGAGHDWLHRTDRTWTMVTATGAPLVDWVGMPAGNATTQMAVRLHRDIGAIEAVLTDATENNEQEAIANAGLRLHAVTFDPPLQLAGGVSLFRVIPGPLSWSNVSLTGPSTGAAVTAWIWTSVPVPGANGTSPPSTYVAPAQPDEDAPLWLGFGLELTNAAQPDAEVAQRSPSIVRMVASVVVADGALRAPPASPTNVTVTWHHDFGSIAKGVGGLEAAPVHATGMAFVRGPAFSVARALHGGLQFGAHHGAWEASQDVAITFDTPPNGRQPSPVPRGLFSPITLNATTLLGPASGDMPWRLLSDGGPVVPAGSGYQAMARAELGFMANDTFAARHEHPGPTGPVDDAPKGGAPALNVVWPILSLVLLLGAIRGRVSPRPSRAPKSCRKTTW